MVPVKDVRVIVDLFPALCHLAVQLRGCDHVDALVACQRLRFLRSLVLEPVATDSPFSHGELEILYPKKVSASANDQSHYTHALLLQNRQPFPPHRLLDRLALNAAFRRRRESIAHDEHATDLVDMVITHITHRYPSIRMFSGLKIGRSGDIERFFLSKMCSVDWKVVDKPVFRRWWHDVFTEDIDY